MDDRKTDKNKKRRLPGFGLVLGLLAAAFLWLSGDLCQEKLVTAWWGTFYPSYCFSELPENGEGELIIKFRCLQGLSFSDTMNGRHCPD